MSFDNANLYYYTIGMICFGNFKFLMIGLFEQFISDVPKSTI